MRKENLLFITFFIILIIVLISVIVFILAAQFTDTSDSDFNLGTFVNTTVEGSGANANVTLNASLDSNTVLLLHMNGTDGSTTFTDVSFSAHSVTANDNAQIDTAQSKLGGSSGLFDTSGDYLSISHSDDWNWGTGDFTVDFWLRRTSLPTFIVPFSWGQDFDGGGEDGIQMFIQSGSTKFVKQIAGSDTCGDCINLDAGVLSYSTGVWYHFAIVRQGNTFTMYRDGVSVATTTDSSSFIDYPGADFEIGRNKRPEGYIDGHIDEFRISKGIARWTSDFTPPTREYPLYNSSGNFTSQSFDATSTSANWTSISWTQEVPYQKEIGRADEDGTNPRYGGINLTGNVLLMHLNNESAFGENDTHVFDFSGSGNNGTVNGSVYNTTDKKFGSASMTFDGVDDYINVSYNNSLDMTVSLTISVWIYHKDLVSQDYIVTKGPTNQGIDSNYILYIKETGELKAHIGNGTASDLLTGNTVFSRNEWHHAAFTVDGTNLKLYLDGVLDATASQNISLTANNDPLIIGKAPDSNSFAFFNGTIDEVAIWNRSLSADEILKLYKRGVLRLNISTRTSDDNSTWSVWSSVYTNNTNSTISQNNTARYLQYRAEFSTTNTFVTPKLLDATVYYTNPCACPSSGNWIINNNAQCSLTTSCTITPNAFRLMNGSLQIMSGGILQAQGCFINDNQSFYIEDGGGLLCS